MDKNDIIDKLMIAHDIWQAGYTRNQLEQCSKKKLLKWLRNLEEAEWMSQSFRKF